MLWDLRDSLDLLFHNVTCLVVQHLMVGNTGNFVVLLNKLYQDGESLAYILLLDLSALLLFQFSALQSPLEFVPLLLFLLLLAFENKSHKASSGLFA